MALDVAAAAKAIISSVSLFLLIASVQLVLLPMLAESFRQRVFRLRRDMFLMVADGEIEPTDPAYTHIRSTMNGVIRFAERVTLLRLLLHRVVSKKQTNEYSTRIRVYMDAVQSPETRKKLELFQMRLGYEIVRHIALTSPMVWIVMVLAAVPLAMLLCAKGLRRGLLLILRSLRNCILTMAERLPVTSIEAEAELLTIQA